jgi:hypothetical protein
MLNQIHQQAVIAVEGFMQGVEGFTELQTALNLLEAEVRDGWHRPGRNLVAANQQKATVTKPIDQQYQGTDDDEDAGKHLIPKLKDL